MPEFRAGRRAVLYALVSLLGGGVCYSLWMATFILTTRRDGPTLEGILWVIAPAITPTGFTQGMMLMDRFTRTPVRSFSSIYKWLKCVPVFVASSR